MFARSDSVAGLPYYALFIRYLTSSAGPPISAQENLNWKHQSTYQFVGLYLLPCS